MLVSRGRNELDDSSTLPLASTAGYSMNNITLYPMHGMEFRQIPPKQMAFPSASAVGCPHSEFANFFALTCENGQRVSVVTVGFSSKLHFLYLLLRSSQQPKLSVRMFQVGRVRSVQSHRSRSLSSRADFPDSGALLRDSRRTQPLLVFVSIKGKEEAFLLPERMASKSLHPVAQCCTFTGGAAGRAEELRCAHELVCPFSEQTNVFTD